MKLTPPKNGFTLVELLVVVAIIAILTAILLPVFFTVRGKARQSVCVSNLRQIGMGMSLYMQDNDGFYPYAVDPVDRCPGVWPGEFGAAIPRLPWLHDALQPYVSSKPLFRCPADDGFDFADFSPVLQNVHPSSYEKYGTSYYYRTELAAFKINESRIQKPELINLVYDGSGAWHGMLFPLQQRYNVLYADGHTKNVSRPQLDDAWAIPVVG